MYSTIRDNVKDAIAGNLAEYFNAPQDSLDPDLVADIADGVFDAMKISEYQQGLERLDADPECISIDWCLQDVMETDLAKELDLTEAEGKQVLSMLKHKHDCNIGITWETIDIWITYVASERKPKVCPNCHADSQECFTQIDGDDYECSACGDIFTKQL